MLDDRAVEKVWRILGWVILVILIGSGGFLVWLQWFKNHALTQMNRQAQVMAGLVMACQPELRRRQSASQGFIDPDNSFKYAPVAGSPNNWRLSGHFLETPTAQTGRAFECQAQQQGSKFKVLDVHFTP